MTTPTRARISRLLRIAAAVCALWAAVVWLSGGFVLTIGAIGLSSREPFRPLAAGIFFLVLAAWLNRDAVITPLMGAATAGIRIANQTGRMVQRAWPRPAVLAAILAAAVAIVSWTYGSKTASGPDSFAYVSQAALWRHGDLDIAIPLARRAPWPDASATFAPFGYRATSNGDAVVPITAPGVPLAMAALQLVGGHCAAFLVTPLSGGLLVWFTFVIGRRMHSDYTGLAAAWLVATSPAVLFMLMWPMTDVPAAAAAAAMTMLLLGPNVRSAALAGLIASAGVLIRPNFVVIAGAAGCWLVASAIADARTERLRRRAMTRVAAYALGVAPAIAFTAWLNTRLFGSAAMSGYGAAGDLLSFDRVFTNASRYAAWLADTSPLLFLGLAAMFIPWTHARRSSDWRTRALLATIVVSTVSVYLVYQTFTDWWYLRFLLPAWPALAVTVALACTTLGARWRVAAVAAVILVVGSGLAGARWAQARGIFGLGEERYVSVAQLVATHTEPDAIVVTMQHAGTVRYYAGRETIRFDLLDSAWLDRAVEWLTARGRHPYILIEDWEIPEFQQRFGPGNAAGRLDYRPVATWESTRVDGRVFLFDPLDRSVVSTSDPGTRIEQPRHHCAPSSFPRLAAYGF